MEKNSFPISKSVVLMYKINSFLYKVGMVLRRVLSNWLDSATRTYYRAKFNKCGKGIYIYHPAIITGPDAAIIGDNVHINRGSFIRAEGGLEIEDNVHIGRNVTIYTINHNYQGKALPYDETTEKKSVKIGKNVWIGMNVTIIPGVTIEEGAIIGAGTVVSRDVPPLAIVGSQVPRIIKYRDKGHYAKLESTAIYGGVGGRMLGK